MSLGSSRLAIVLFVLSVAAGCGGGDSGGGPVFTETGPTRALAVPGTSCTMGQYVNSAHRVSTDAFGTVYLASICGGQGYLSTSEDAAKTFGAPASIGLANLTQIAVEGGPSGVAYVVATTDSGEARFTRTLNRGATWDVPTPLATGVFSDRGASIATRGDEVFVQTVAGGASTVHRNASRGLGAFSSTALPTTQDAVFYGLLVDGSGRLWSGLDNAPLYLSGSGDGGVTFGPWAAVAGAAVGYSDWAIGANTIWVAGSATSFRISVAAPSVGTAVSGLLAPANAGEATLAVDDAGTAHVATGNGAGVHLQQALLTDASFGASTTVDALGRFPAVTAPPGSGKVIVAYERSGEIWTAVRVY